jgi:hypothetical protein
MDFNIPRNNLPVVNPWLSPSIEQFDQWIRLTIGSSLSLTVTAPIWRAITLNMAQREHRRQGRFVPPPQGPFLPFASVGDALKQVWTQEGWRGYFRGMGALYIVMPIRAAYHVILFNLVEPNDPNSLRSNRIATSSVENSASLLTTTPDSHRNKSQNQIVSQALKLDPSASQSSQSSKTSSEITQTSYLLKAFGIILTGELFLYPARWAFTRLSGDLVGAKKTILSNRSTSLILHTIQSEGVLALYRGFFPCLLAVSLPALAFANSRFLTRRNAYREQTLEMNSKPSSQTQKLDSRESVSEEEEEEEPSRSSSFANYLNTLTEAKKSDPEFSKYSSAWLVAMILSYPLICVHMRMAIGNQVRVPREHVLKQMSPVLRQIIPTFLPSYSTAASSSFAPTYLRVLEGGPEAAYTKFAQVLGLRLVFELGADVWAALLAWPLNWYINSQEFGVWSLDTPSEVKKQLDEDNSLEQQRLQMEEDITALRNAPPASLRHDHKKVNEERDIRRYEYNDASLEVLGLTPVVPAKGKLPSIMAGVHLNSDPTRPKSMAELLDETPISVLASDSPRSRVSIDANPHTPTTPSAPSSAAPAPSSQSSVPKPSVPLLSQPRPWYDSNRRDRDSNL